MQADATLLLPVIRIPRPRNKKPRTLSGTGVATGGPPVLQARPV